MATIKSVKDATHRETEFLERAAHSIDSGRGRSKRCDVDGVDLWEEWDIVDMMWWSWNDLSFIFTLDDSFSVTVVRVFSCFDNTAIRSGRVEEASEGRFDAADETIRAR